MPEIEKRLKKQVEATKKRFEDIEDPAEADQEILDVELTVGLDGAIRNIKMITTTGGPHVEIDLGDEKVEGYWGGNKSRKTLDENTSETFWNYYKEIWKSMK